MHFKWVVWFCLIPNGDLGLRKMNERKMKRFMTSEIRQQFNSDFLQVVFNQKRLIIMFHQSGCIVCVFVILLLRPYKNHQEKITIR